LNVANINATQEHKYQISFWAVNEFIEIYKDPFQIINCFRKLFTRTISAVGGENMETFIASQPAWKPEIHDFSEILSTDAPEWVNRDLGKLPHCRKNRAFIVQLSSVCAVNVDTNAVEGSFDGLFGSTVKHFIPNGSSVRVPSDENQLGGRTSIIGSEFQID
jgi:hypothetical protein